MADPFRTTACPGCFVEAVHVGPSPLDTLAPFTCDECGWVEGIHPFFEERALSDDGDTYRFPVGDWWEES
jgi:hypothetical protein